MLKSLVCTALGLWLAGMFSTSVQSADILVSPSPGAGSLVRITGQLEFVDAVTFLRKTGALKEAVVLLRSPGGNAAAGVLIGRAIRKKGFQTIVPTSVKCISACALAWLGGARRFMGEGARIGFHAAYSLRGGRPARHSSANTHVVNYMRQLGLSSRAIARLVHASPGGMYWLTRRSARDIGIKIGF
jgi:hypothetical protein